MREAVILSARRTAVMPRDGAFAACDIHDLAAPVLQAVLRDAGLAPEDLDEVIMSNALGAGGNPARIAALAAGLPERVAGLTIDRQCVGGLDAILLARAMVVSGQHDVVIAGGAESYSRRPLRSRRFADGRSPEPYDQARFTPWADRDPDMADAADRLATKLDISRSEQDLWAVKSHAKAVAARPDGTTEIVPILGHDTDGFTRKLTQKLCARAPVVAGTITAANMAVAADGAAFCVVTTPQNAARLGKRPVEIVSGATCAGDPTLPGLAPVDAMTQALAAADVTPADLRVAEIMEAFAVQAIACQQRTGIATDIVNPGGGALARGHPVGASGAILAVRLFHALQKQGGTGLAAIAAAGGLGAALMLRARI